MKEWKKGTPLTIKFRLLWHRLWLRKDEFHNSLELDSISFPWLTKSAQQWYINDLVKRRNAAHERDLN